MPHPRSGRCVLSPGCALARSLHHGRPVSRVLVVDDDVGSRAAVSALAREGGHHTAEAGSGVAAAELLTREPFDVVLYELALATRDHYAAFVAFRAHTASVSLPIILLVQHADRVNVEAALAAGGDDILVRPIRLAELNARVRSLTGAYAAVRNERAATALAVMLLRKSEPNRTRPFRTPMLWLIGPLTMAGSKVMKS